VLVLSIGSDNFHPPQAEGAVFAQVRDFRQAQQGQEPVELFPCVRRLADDAAELHGGVLPARDAFQIHPAGAGVRQAYGVRQAVQLRQRLVVIVPGIVELLQGADAAFGGEHDVRELRGVLVAAADFDARRCDEPHGDRVGMRTVE